MRRLTLLFAALILASTAKADWPLEDLNRAINQTNFVVEDRCSGTLVYLPDRLVVTNYHCIEHKVTVIDRQVTDRNGVVRKVSLRRYGDVSVTQHSYDGHVRVGTAAYVAEIVAEDKKRDLAVLRIRSAIPHTYASPILPEGEQVVRGQPVWIVGNPAMQDGTVVTGIVSNLNRAFDFPWTDNERLPMIQFSGGIWGGNSGGAIYDAKGRLIGVPAAVNRQANFIGLAIPVHILREFMRENCLARAFDPKATDDKCRLDRAHRETQRNNGE